MGILHSPDDGFNIHTIYLEVQLYTLFACSS